VVQPVADFKLCWSLEALRLPVDRYCLSGFVFQLNLFAMNYLNGLSDDSDTHSK